MKNKIRNLNYVFISLLLITLIISCSKEEKIIDPDPDPLIEYIDTIRIEIKDGVFTELNFLEDEYTLDDTIHFESCRVAPRIIYRRFANI